MSNRRRPRGPSAGEEGNHLWAASAQAVVKAVRCVSNRTRPVSWLGPETSGTHPRTKGARCSAGGHRHRIPSTRRVSWPLAAMQASRQETPRHRRENLDQRNGAMCDSGRNGLLVPLAHRGPTGRAHRCRRDRALGSPREAGCLPRRHGVARGFGHQDALGERRCLRGAPLLPVDDSTCRVPLQSG